MTITTIALVWLVYTNIGLLIALHFIYVWGWGDASWGDKTIHPGTPDDLWHRCRRRAFYAVAIWACVGNPIALAILAIGGRRAFRKGVWDVDGGKTFNRWFGGTQK